MENSQKLSRDAFNIFYNNTPRIDTVINIVVELNLSHEIWYYSNNPSNPIYLRSVVLNTTLISS